MNSVNDRAGIGCGESVTPDRRTGGGTRAHAGTHVTKIQAAVFDGFIRTHSMSEVGRELGLSQIRVREALVQYERNLMRDRGMTPPPLKAMLRGDVTTRFGVSRDLHQGRPAKHAPPAAMPIPAAPGIGWRERPIGSVQIDAPRRGTTRLIVTGAEGGTSTHLPFWLNLRAYAEHLGARIVVMRSDHEDLGPVATELRPHVIDRPMEIASRLDLRPDVRLPRVARSPLDRLERASPGRWAILAHPVFQLSSLPRLPSQPPRIHLTTGVANRPRGGGQGEHPGAVVVEVTDADAVFVRSIRGDHADGAFHDLDVHVANGQVASGRQVAALVFGDIHHARIDPAVELATWGAGTEIHGLVGRLRPRLQVMHDLVDFLARNPHDRNDPHARFLRHVTGTGDVRDELASAAAFLASTRRPWSSTVVVHSNHDDRLVRWLKDADYRLDPLNAEFHLDRQRALLARLRAGAGADSFLAETLRELDRRKLDGVRFLADGESLIVAGVELGVHGHAGADGSRGSRWALERLGVEMVVGHSHRPSASAGVHVAGVCQLDMGYNKGPTTWAVAHVLVHEDGARQHLFMDQGRFAA